MPTFQIATNLCTVLKCPSMYAKFLDDQKFCPVFKLPKKYFNFLNERKRTYDIQFLNYIKVILSLKMPKNLIYIHIQINTVNLKISMTNN